MWCCFGSSFPDEVFPSSPVGEQLVQQAHQVSGFCPPWLIGFRWRWIFKRWEAIKYLFKTFISKKFFRAAIPSLPSRSWPLAREIMVACQASSLVWFICWFSHLKCTLQSINYTWIGSSSLDILKLKLRQICQIFYDFRFMMIPFLDLEPLLQAPAGHPESKAEVIQLIWGAVNSNFCGFRGVPSLL